MNLLKFHFTVAVATKEYATATGIEFHLKVELGIKKLN